MPLRTAEYGITAARRAVSLTELRRKQAQGLYRPGQRALVRLNATTTEVLVMQDEIDFDEWDEEELRRGRRRNADGQFKGPDPEIVPASVARAYERRVLSTAEKRMREALADAVETVHDLIIGVDVDDKVRLDASKLLLEHVKGKPEGRTALNVTGDEVPPWKATLSRAIVSDPGDEDEGIAPVEPITKAPSAKKRAAPKKKVARKKA